MRILLIGEYSRLHLSLAEGLRSLGHEVLLVSDGDSFKNYEREIDITRKSSGICDTVTGLISLFRKFSYFKGYDIVQIINPCFTTFNVRINRYLYKQLKKKNKKIFLGAFGDDTYWVRACMGGKTFKYSEFVVNGENTNLKFTKRLEQMWVNSNREELNREIAASVDGIVACCYEYYKSYEPFFSKKLEYIPLPINTAKIEFAPIDEMPSKVIFFVGVNEDRKEYKGTDIMEKALLRLAKKYPDQTEVRIVKSVSYNVYQSKMDSSHVILDQLYSYSPAMNALLALSKGKIAVGGGEPEIYELLDEEENHPVINVIPDEDDVFDKLEQLVLNKSIIPRLSQNGRLFVEKHHDYISVAREYISFWNKKGNDQN